MENQTTVLIVDDEEVGREALEGVFFTEGYNLVFATDGNDAYEKAVRLMPDVILLDVMMPGTDGFQVSQKIRSNPLIAEIPIIIITALDDRDSKMRGIESGADDFITKPFDRFEIRARVRTIVRLNRYRHLVMERVRFGWVVEQAREGYLVLDTNGDIVYSNPAAKNLLGISNEASRVPFLDHVKTNYQLEPEESWRLWPDVCGRQLYMIRPENDKNQFVILSAEVLELPMGTFQKVLVRITDVTTEFARQQELWSFHQAVSHKLRTPVAQFIMAAQLIHRQADQPDPENIKELSKMMIDGARQLEESIQEILRYSHISDMTRAGKRLNLAELPVIIREICEELGIEKCRVEGKPELKSRTLGLTYRAAEVIFRELLSNAKKFHPSLSPALDIKLQLNGENNIMISVADDGISLAPDQLAAVWQPYYQVEKVFSGNISGMGLGLSVVAKLVWEVGGNCRLYNRVGQPGVVVELVLPIL